jgi:hypothetical protein
MHADAQAGLGAELPPLSPPTYWHLPTQVHLAEMGAEPRTCVLTGSALPGLARDRLLELATGTASPTMEQLDGTALMKAAKALNFPTNLVGWWLAVGGLAVGSDVVRKPCWGGGRCDGRAVGRCARREAGESCVAARACADYSLLFVRRVVARCVAAPGAVTPTRPCC